MRQIERGDPDLFLKNGVAIRKSWSFRSGVTELYPPYYDGWRNGKTVKGLYENYLDQGEPGYTLSSVYSTCLILGTNNCRIAADNRCNTAII